MTTLNLAIEKTPLERYVPPEKPSLVGLSRAQLGEILIGLGTRPAQVKMRVQQLWHWLYVRGVTDFDAMTSVSKDLRAQLAAHHTLARPEVVAEQISADGTRKWLLRLPGEAGGAPHEVECVYIPETDRGTLCLSSQVGCTLNCSFCHTGTQRLVRNLTAGEIVGQVMIARDRLEDWSPTLNPSPASGGGKGGGSAGGKEIGEEPRVGALTKEKPARASSCTYQSFNLGAMGSTSAASSQVMGGGIKPGMGIALETSPLAEDVEVTGPLMASFYVSSSSEDCDLFLTLRNFDASGNEVMETGQQGSPVPVAKGWLRASHRELDPDLSLPYRPYHRHTRRQFLKPGEIVKVDVEIWPTSMVFAKGHRIQLDVQPRDGAGSQGYLHYHADYNTGTNTVYAGGEYESYLLLPVIPKA